MTAALTKGRQQLHYRHRGPGAELRDRHPRELADRPHGHRIKAPLEYSRGPEKTWVYGGLRVADGQAVTMCASSRNSAFYQDFLQLAEQANPEGTLYVITDNLSSHDSKSTRAWLEDHQHPGSGTPSSPRAPAGS